MSGRDRTILVFDAAYLASTKTRSLDRSVDAMAAVGRYHADELQREKIAMQKRHARQLRDKIMGGQGRCFDWSWFRQESQQNDRTIRIVERWFSMMFHSAQPTQGTSL